MEFVARLGSKSATNYPLPLQGEPAWTPGEAGWYTQVELPVIPRDHIIVPSFAMLHADYRFRFNISSAGEPCGKSELMWVPSGPGPYRNAADNRAVVARIDCWHTQKKTAAIVELVVLSDEKPRDELLTVSVRPLTIKDPGRPATAVMARRPGPVSQMMAPSSIARGICSPTALSMAIDSCWPQTVRACYDPLTRAYGCWPLAIHWAARQGVIAAVEVLSDWRDVSTILGQGRAVVCSINYASNALPGSPMPATSGHLVVLYGIEDDAVCVMDPAAKSHAAVDVRYPSKEFGQAWLAQRGACYIFGS